MDQDKYIIEINKIADLIKKSNLKSKVVFITPWNSLSGDLVSVIHGEKKKKLFDKYSSAFKEQYINLNSDLKAILNDYTRHDYMFDFIHPNDNKGIELYSEAKLKTLK